MAELKEAAESTWSKETTTTNTPVTVNSTTDVQSDDQLQGSTDDNSPSLLLLPSTPTIISEVGCKISLGQISGFEVLGCKISLGQISDGLGKLKTRFRVFGIDMPRNGFN